MQGIVDRLLVLICCSALLPGRVDDIAAIVAVLAAMTVNALNGYVKSRAFLVVSIASYTVASMV